MVKLQVGLLSAAVVLLTLASAHGQNPDAAPSPYFDCPYVNYFRQRMPAVAQTVGRTGAAASATARGSCGAARPADPE